MTRVYLGLGSNIEPEKNLALGVAELERRFGRVELSPVYRAPAIGFESPDFLETDLAPGALLDIIEEIHDVAGRERDASNKWVARSLDIDLLLYGKLVSPDRPLRVPREDVLDYAFVLRPLAELAPDGVHPVTGRTFADHWAEFDDEKQVLTRVDLDLREAAPSPPN